MNESCRSKNPLVRDGISQKQRLLKTLLPSYVSVDERSMKDLAGFVKNLGSEIRYFEYDGSTVINDTWDIFFDIASGNWEDFDMQSYLEKLKIKKETQPHLALFFGFLYLFRIAQDDMNTITKRHLDFYYHDGLQLKENPAVPDQVAVIFNLAKNVDYTLISKGTRLKAGKDDTGVERIYEVQKDIVINKAKITDIKSVFINIHDRLKDDVPGLENDNRIYVSPVANSEDGEGGKIQNEEKSWRTFGEPLFTGSGGNYTADRKQPEIGFAFASPVLFMAEGTRTVTLEINLLEAVTFSGLNHDHFIVRFSGEKEWITADAVSPVQSNLSGSTLTIERTGEANAKPISGCFRSAV